MARKPKETAGRGDRAPEPAAQLQRHKIKRHGFEPVADWSLEDELARGGGTLDPDGPVIEDNVALARRVLAAAGHDPTKAVPLLLDGGQGLPGGDVAPVATVDRELAVQIVRHGEGMERALERNNARLMRYHALRYMNAVRDLQQLGSKTGRPAKVTWALIDEVEREGHWPKVELMVEEIARRADVAPSNVWEKLRARRRK